MYDHKQIEESILAFWEKQKIYEKVKESHSKDPPFYFCDGPPYATGQIHPGTAWNKAIKDSICRYWSGVGHNVRAQPGYDTHGLPIEVKVEKEIGIKKKHDIEKIGVEKFIKECKKFATKYIEVMGKQFQSVGVWMDFDDPYITYKDSYIESSWKTLKMAYDKGLMKEGKYVLPYCYRCETTMANYELEYGEETDPSIFVKMKVKGKENEYLIIWTTTPWTLVANMGIMVHPTFSYVKIKVENEVWIVAKERMDYLLAGKSAIVLEELSGKKLEGTSYEHPFQSKIKKEYDRKVILSDEYVTLEEGTGLVHTAPGHGEADFIIGKRFGIEPFSPVDEQGRYTAEAGEFAGKNVRETNPEIIELLKENGSLIHADRIKHRYPHCWRCKTPLIMMTTNQWFITISNFKDRMKHEIENIEWHPEFAKNRFKDFVEAAPDWCISRQRYWGIPLPIWKCDSCKKLKVIGTKDELKEGNSGKEVKELHRPYVDEVEFECSCKGKMKRIPDVLDVWFDSGNSVWASLKEGEAEKYGNQSEIIIEGQDQIRGWFYSLLGSGLIRYDKSPYKRLLMHGFFVDEKGEKMSKSIGNFVPLEEILAKHGADSFRLWGLSYQVWDELKFNWTEIKEAYGDLNILYNMEVFMNRFCEQKPRKPKNFRKEDLWILSRLNNCLSEFHSAFKNCEIHKGVKAIRAFLVEDFSRGYMKIAKNRISKEEDGGAAKYTIYTCMKSITRLFGVITPFLAEHVYQSYFKKFEGEDSLFMLPIDNPEQELIDNSLEKKMRLVQEICSNAMTVRQKTGIKTRWPIRYLYLGGESQEVKESVEMFTEVMTTILNVKEIKFVTEKPAGNIIEGDFSLGKIYIDSALDESLYEEGMVNEIKRRIQNMRKEAGLVEKDEIEVWIDSEKELEAILKKGEKQIIETVNAKKIYFGEKKTKGKEFEIDGRRLTIAIKVG